MAMMDGKRVWDIEDGRNGDVLQIQENETTKL